MNTNDLKTPQEISRKYENIVTKNFGKLLDSTGYSQNKLALELKARGVDINQGTISKYINGYATIQLSVIVKICDIFNISILDLVNEDFEYGRQVVFADDCELEEIDVNNSNLVISRLGDKFVSNPQNEAFNGYLQKYYCYFFPTLSGEQKILTGILDIKAEASYCSASLGLNTNRKKNGKPVYKYYYGCAVISKAVETLYIILSSSTEGEICVINLRHFFIRHHKLDCRMAEVITNGAGERHFPTVHRMLLSSMPIKEEHWQYITPHFFLNSSNIWIEKEKLANLRKESEVYSALIDHLVHNIKPIDVFSLKEGYVTSNANQFLSKEDARIFLSQIRNASHKMRYNKVSNKLDETVRELLLSLGYYKDSDAEEV